MEVFSVFATLSLVDLLSSPLDRIKRAMKGVDLTTAGLGERMGNLALAMGPAALAAGLLVGALGIMLYRHHAAERFERYGRIGESVAAVFGTAWRRVVEIRSA